MGKFRVVATFVSWIGISLWIAVFPAAAQDVRAKAEAEGKLMFYATFNAADSKTLVDGFKQLYPKIDAAYYRSNDAALMERYVTTRYALGISSSFEAICAYVL